MVPDDCEEVDMIDIDVTKATNFDAPNDNEDDDEDPRGAGGGVGCRQQ